MTILIPSGGAGDCIIPLAVLGPQVRAIAALPWERAYVDGSRRLSRPEEIAGAYRLNHCWALGSGRGGPCHDLRLIQRTTGIPVFLLDAESTCPMEQQLESVLRVTGAREMLLADTGGDLLATRVMPSLVSPLQETLMIRALRGTLADATTVMVSGAGLDGEVTLEEFEEFTIELGAVRTGVLGPTDAARTMPDGRMRYAVRRACSPCCARWGLAAESNWALPTTTWISAPPGPGSIRWG